jgi:[protein-PII] uridylyltransferase
VKPVKMPSSARLESAVMISPVEELKASRAELLARFSSGEVQETFQESYAEIVDQYFRRSLQESRAGQRLFREKKPFAFVAVGGYARMELCLHSDVDVVFLFDSKVPALAKALAEDVLYPLWDLGLELGHGTRSIKDCLALAGEDYEVLTSMLDARFICGDSPLYLDLMEQLQVKTISKKAAAFTQWLGSKNELRMACFGDASYLLEPNIKEGIGGLRDYHHILWLAKTFFQLRSPRDLEYHGILSHQEYQDLKESVQFIGLVRNHLHRLSGRKNDRLSFDHQEKIARILRFQGKGDVLAVEQFLAKLHACMASVKSLRRSFLLTHPPKELPPGKKEQEPGEVGFDSATSILKDPLIMMDIFVESCRLRRPISLESKRLIREFLHLVDDGFRRAERAVRAFLFIVNHQNAFEALDQMLELGLLSSFVPEFKPIKDRVQFDNYHLYPVDRHALQTLRHLKNLNREKDLLLLATFADLTDPEPFFLASLFHDIGKIGKDHARTGMLITRAILKRMGYDRRKSEDVLFLVNHHLLLAETATRRDLNDEKIIVQCAGTVGSIERLKMLYLLTWADGRATGPRAWNEWIGNLVQELFFKILHTLERGELATPDASRRVSQTLETVGTELAGQVDPRELEEHFEAMTPRYLLERRPGEIIRHLLQVRSLREPFGTLPPNAFRLEATEGFPPGTYEVTFLGKDRTGLFADLAGIMALNNINILSAHIYTWNDGTVVDIFTVTSPLDPMRSNEIWEKVKDDLEKTFAGRLDLTERLKEKAEPSVISQGRKWNHRPEVEIDNDSSDFFTLIEVFADDRIGLLHQITHTLFDLGLDIRIAKIATKKDQVADVFYVRDFEGEKVLEAEKLAGIKQALLTALGL